MTADMTGDELIQHLTRRLKATNDPSDEKALAVALYRRSGDCQRDLRKPWSRRCGNGSQRVTHRVDESLPPARQVVVDQIIPPCPSCRARLSRDQAVNLALTPDQRNWVRGFKSWPYHAIRFASAAPATRLQRRRAVFLRKLADKFAGYAWLNRDDYTLRFRPGLPPEDALVDNLGDTGEGDKVHAYYYPKITNENWDARKANGT